MSGQMSAFLALLELPAANEEAQCIFQAVPILTALSQDVGQIHLYQVFEGGPLSLVPDVRAQRSYQV